MAYSNIGEVAADKEMLTYLLPQILSQGPHSGSYTNLDGCYWELGKKIVGIWSMQK